MSKPTIEDEHINFADGNLVILAGPGADIPGRGRRDGPVHSFRCHQSVLARRSEPFQQMFGMPGSVPDEYLDGIPAVTLPDDWQDVRDLLRLLYDYLEIPRRHRDARTLETMAGPLRLAKKYMMTDIWTTLSQIFEDDWPMDLDHWYQAEDITAANVKAAHDHADTMMGSEKWQTWDINNHVPDPALAARLALELHIPHALRSAFYDLNRVFYASPFLEYDAFRRTEARRVVHPALDPPAFAALVGGRERLRARTAAYLRALPDRLVRASTPRGYALPWQSCHGMRWSIMGWGDARESWPCEPQIRAWAARVAEKLRMGGSEREGVPSFCVDPLAHLRRLQEKLTSAATPAKEVEGMCVPCRWWVAEILRMDAQRLWDDLPALFELPPGC
ncbi:hypothetical protein PsYK624_042720 [Phanerochaete sordida]|uniref:BTB domain-containing protein n=1 Tax=Phanerochaete sordida TaxID=48140 RepID=A0A9P3G640_9APHY|nr:hypothetical protein PsYK624_042720 [Phanerochaete sordida]